MRNTARLTAFACALATSATALATENGGSFKPPGVETIRVGILLPPGQPFLMANASTYRADRFLDGSGNDRTGISNVDFSFSALSMRLQYVWPELRVWGAELESRAGVVAYANGQSAFDLQTPGGRIHRDFSSSGLGDMFVAPALLGWRGESFHHIAGLALYVPTGKFDRTVPVSIGRNHWALSPVWLATWFPTPAVELDASLFYIVNAENRDTDYKSGHEVSFDWAAGYTPANGWQFGASGYFYQQVTDDKQSGQVFGNGNRGKAVAIGPYVRVYGKGWGVTFKWQHETDVENRAKGERFFLHVGIPL